MKNHRIVKRLLAHSLVLTIILTMFSGLLPVAAAEGRESTPFYYENPLDSKEGLIHISSNQAHREFQEWDIVETDGRTALKISGVSGNKSEFAILDTNAKLPAAGVVEFDMKAFGLINSATGGFIFGASPDEAQSSVPSLTWVSLNNFDGIRIHHREEMSGKNIDVNTALILKEGVWQHWRVEYKDTSMVIYIDEKEVYNGGLPGDAYAKAGLAGFMTWWRGETYFDNFVAKEYEALPAPDMGSDEELGNAVYLKNDVVQVAVDKTFPQALHYSLLSNDSKLYAGYTKAEHKAYLTDDTATEGTAYDAVVTEFRSDAASATYTLSVPDFHGGLEVTYRFTLEGNELVKKITGITGPGEPYLVSLKLDTPILRVKATQDNAQVAHNVELSPDRFNNWTGDQESDVIGALDSLDFNNGKLTDWAFLYTGGVLGTAYNTLIDVPYSVRIKKVGGVKQAILSDREYYYRLAYQPNEDADGVKKLGELTRYDIGEPFESRVFISGDQNENGKIDWQDGAAWVRRQLPEISDTLKAFMDAGGTWQHCHGTFPLDPTTSEVKIPYDVYAAQARKAYYMTDGAPQAYAIAGWQQHGHDWRWGDWDQPISPAAGGEEGAWNAWNETKKYGSDISFHVNQEICTTNADSYDINMVARKSNGDEQLYHAIFGQPVFRNKSYFLDWAAGNTKARMDKFFQEQFWAPAVLYNDQLWDNVSPYNGVYGVHESYAKKKIVETYKSYGVNVTTEGYQPTILRSGLAQWKYHKTNTLISNFIVAGYGTAQMYTTDPYFQIFGAKAASNARMGNIMTTPDFDKAIVDHYLYAAPTSYLRQFEALEYIDNDEMQAVRWSDGVEARYIKAKASLEFVENGVVVLEGNNRFLPDLETPESKIHVYSQGGMAKPWELPAYWNGVTSVDQYELTSNGQVYIGRLPVENGSVAPVCSARVPYIIVPASTEEIPAGPVNLAKGSGSTAPDATDGNSDTVWTADTKTPVIEIDFGREREVNRVELQEQGANISAFTLEMEKNGVWSTVSTGTLVGADKRIVFPSALGSKIRLSVTDALGNPSIKELKVFADANLSLYATASASSEKNHVTVYPDDKGVDVTYKHYSYAYAAADDSLDTMWLANGTDGQHLDLTFNRLSKVNRVVLREQGNNITSFKILGSKEKGAWTELYAGTTIGELLEIDFATTTVDKIRLLVETAESNPAILEFGVYGVGMVDKPAIAKGNLALNKPAEQSSTYTASSSPAVAGRAVDGDTNPDWGAQSIAGTNAEVGAWWQVDLGGVFDISAIKLFSRNIVKERLGNVDVSVLDENKNVVWTTHMDDPPEVSTTLTVEGEAGAAVKGRYVRIQHPESAGKLQLEIVECEVYEKMSDLEQVDKSALQILYDECVPYTDALYTPASWKTFSEALAAAKNVLENPDATNAQVEKANYDLFYAREHLREKDGDKTLLSNLIETAKLEAATTGVYTPASIAALNAAIQRAEEELASVVTITEVNMAIARLQMALDALKIAANKTMLTALYNDSKDKTQGSYTDESWELFQTALSNAKDVLEKVKVTQEEVDGAFYALALAINGLETEVNYDALALAIELGDKTDTTGSTPASVQALTDALEAGRLVILNGAADQTEVDDATKAIMQAMIHLTDKADKTRLTQLIETVEKLTEGKYTPATWQRLQDTLDAANTVMDDENAVQQAVENAYDALADALAGLKTKADKEALRIAIETAKPIVDSSELYVPSLIEGLAELLASAEELYADAEATQNEVSDKAEELLTAASKARLKANKTALESAVQKADEIEVSLYTKESLSPFLLAQAKAKELLADDSLSVDNQAQVDETVRMLEAALASLVPLKSSGGVSEPGDSNGGSIPNNGGASTGDTLPITGIALLGLAALGAIACLRKKVK